MPASYMKCLPPIFMDDCTRVQGLKTCKILFDIGLICKSTNMIQIKELLAHKNIKLDGGWVRVK